MKWIKGSHMRYPVLYKVTSPLGLKGFEPCIITKNRNEYATVETRPRSRINLTLAIPSWPPITP